MQTVSIRLEESQDKELEAYAKKNQIDKSTAARKIIEEGLKNVKHKEAIENIQSKRWTIWKAANYCGESFRSFLQILKRENVVYPLSLEELELEINEDSSK